MLQEDYGNERIVHIDWQNSGSLNNPDAQARGSYYGVSSVPHSVFDGQNPIVGSYGSPQANYNVFLPIFLAHEAESSKVMVDAFVTFDPGSLQGYVEVTVEIAPGETVIPTNRFIRAAIFIRAWQSGPTTWHDMGIRLPLNVPLTISSGGQTQTASRTFSLDPADVNQAYVNNPWDWGQLRAIGFVQNDGSRKVLNANLAPLAYDLQVTNLDHQVQKVTGAENAEVNTEVEYLGAIDDTVTVTMDKSGLPAGWDAELVWNSTVYPSGFTIPAMTEGQIEAVMVRTIPGAGPGLGSVSVTTEPVSEPFRGTTYVYSTFKDTDAILFVDDDRGATTETIYEAAIAGAGYHSLTYDFLALSYPTADYLAPFDAVVWTTGEMQSGTIGNNAQAELISFMDGGGRLFVSSQGFLNQYGAGGDFASNYLRVASFNQDPQADSAYGVGGDPIGDGWVLELNPPFVDFADRMTPGTGAVTWLNSEEGPIGLRYDAGVFRTVFMCAAFDGVPAGPAMNEEMMHRILDWILAGSGLDVTTEPAAGPVRLALSQNAPNPFAGATQVRYSIPDAGPVKLSVFNVTGRKVTDLVNGMIPAGNHVVSWNGVDAAGNRVASGVYLYRIEAAGESLTKEMVLLR
jgi:hypothetical protein